MAVHTRCEVFAAIGSGSPTAPAIVSLNVRNLIKHFLTYAIGDVLAVYDGIGLLRACGVLRIV